MPRLTCLDDVLFPVETHPVFASLKTPHGERRLPIPDKTAIVNLSSGRVVGVVGRGYRLVRNAEALEMAYECARTVFPETAEGEWEVKSVDAPATGGHCFIDLVHRSSTLDFTFAPPRQRPDAFGPFIRAINSYNGLRALVFEIGFYRKVCRNGLILPESVIKLKYVHMKRELGLALDSNLARSKLATMKAGFLAYLRAVKACPVGRPQFEPLLLAVLGLREPKRAKEDCRVAADWEGLARHIEALCDRYARELGENAYAALNAITEFASHPPKNRCIHTERHSFQRKAGTWLAGFSRACRQPGFELKAHIEGFGNQGGGSVGKRQAQRRRP